MHPLARPPAPRTKAAPHPKAARQPSALQPKPDSGPPSIASGDEAVLVTVSGQSSRPASRSLGHPRSGRLEGGVVLKPSTGIRLRYPKRAWGTEDTIFDLLDAIDAVRRKHPNAPAVLIGDLSLRDGGPMAPHASHQSGRDVDIGLYFDDAPREGLTAFRHFDAGPWDKAMTWTLVTALIGPDLEKTRVSRIFLDWRAQEDLRAYAAATGVSKAILDRVFQVPHQKQSIIRHVDGHEGHLHVRFRCPRGQLSCTDQLPEEVAVRAAKKTCVRQRRQTRKKRSQLKRLIEGSDGVLGQLRATDDDGRADVFCFVEEVE